MPAALTQFGIGRDFHAGTRPFDPRLAEQQALWRNAVILFPADLFDRVLPGQGKPRHRQFSPHHPGQAHAQSDHAIVAWACRPRQKCWARNSATRAKPISSLIGVARIRLAPAAKPSARSHQAILQCRKPVNTAPQIPIATAALNNTYTVASQLSPCSISAGSYTAMKGTTKPAMAIRIAHRLIFNPVSLAIGAAAKQASATGGVRSAMMPK